MRSADVPSVGRTGGRGGDVPRTLAERIRDSEAPSAPAASPSGPIPVAQLPATPALSARRARTRDRLMDAATAVFAERGISGASVEEISEAAGFTRGAFYSNFEDKNDLVLALIQRAIAVQYQAAEQAVAAMTRATGRTPEELLSVALTQYTVLGSTTLASMMTQQELQLYAAREPSLREPYLAFFAECTKGFTKLIGDAMTASGLEFSCPAEDAIELLVAAHQRMQVQSLFTQTIDTHILHALLLAISRPAGPDPATTAPSAGHH